VTSTIVSGPGLGNYAPVPLLTNYGPHTVNLVSLTGTTINNFERANASRIFCSQRSSAKDVAYTRAT